jgi:hypothetical protein
MISNLQRSTRTIVSAPQIACCQCAQSASDEMPLMELSARIDGEPVSFYTHARCLMDLAKRVERDHTATIAAHRR